jgi:hypothetical protein
LERVVARQKKERSAKTLQTVQKGEEDAENQNVFYNSTLKKLR